VHDPLPGKPPEGKLDGGEGARVSARFLKVLEVLDETPVVSESGEGALYHPAARQHDETHRDARWDHWL
jgi:hypothetical protein